MTKDEVIDVLKHNYPSACFTDLCEAVDMAIEALERKYGEWIILYDEDSPQDGIWKCSVCGYTRPVDDITPINYCPNCGADMWAQICEEVKCKNIES